MGGVPQIIFGNVDISLNRVKGTVRVILSNPPSSMHKWRFTDCFRLLFTAGKSRGIIRIKHIFTITFHNIDQLMFKGTVVNQEMTSVNERSLKGRTVPFKPMKLKIN